MFSSQTTITVIRLRTPMAPTAPQTIARFCSATGRLRAARAMTIALSPASTRSMITMASKAERNEAGSIGGRLGVVAAMPILRSGAVVGFMNRDGSRISIDRIDRDFAAGASGPFAAVTMAARAVFGPGLQSGSSPRPGSPGRPIRRQYGP